MEYEYRIYTGKTKFWVLVSNGHQIWRLSTMERAAFLRRSDVTAFHQGKETSGDIGDATLGMWNDSTKATLEDVITLVSEPVQTAFRVLSGWTAFPDPLPVVDTKKFKIIHGLSWNRL